MLVEHQGIVVPPGSTMSSYDILRRKYMKKLVDHTKRPVIVYGTSWLEAGLNPPAGAVSVALGDVHGFMEACSNIKGPNLDLIISSPGGSVDAAESIMGYLRTRFDNVRAIIPMAAMSAATMMALSCDEIVMGSYSQLGPIDPQFTIQTPEGPRSAPGQAILDQFEQAKIECQNPANIAAWLPMLRALLPGLIAQCEAARTRSIEFAEEALEKYMFDGDADAHQKAADAAAWFGDFAAFKSHGRRVSRDDARAQNLMVVDLETDKVLQDLVLSVYHAMRLTFTGTGTVKLIENNEGRAYIEMMMTQQVFVPFPGGPGGPGAPGPAGPHGPTPMLPAMPPSASPGAAFGGNRQQRRAAGKNK